VRSLRYAFGMRACEWCGDDIPDSRPTAKCCSQRCVGFLVAARRGQAGTIDVECAHCGVIFQAFAGNHPRYCSRSCSDEVRRLERPACGICGNPVRLMRNRYCSKSCSNAARPKPDANAWSTVYGRLQRANPDPEPCALCGGTGEQRHHFDYNRLDDITWLCRRCHQRMHHEGKRLADKKVRPATVQIRS